ncbi:phage portal protein [Sphaerisporangium rhizosphaerae]|uniref:Phage portal protein n=1 Tax=Sphaerisporangium rhizosphaerae TaxID=2269375 RepID=A0ABW2NXF3_9ACTN
MGMLFGPRAANDMEKRSFVPPPMFAATSSFDSVDLSRAETSLQKVAVWSSIDLLGSLGSELPFDVYRGYGANKVELPIPPWLQDPAADGHGVQDWLYQLYSSWFLRGNAYGIVRDRSSRGDAFPTAIELLHPDHMNVWMSKDGPVFSYMGEQIEAADRFHSRAYPMAGHVLGMSPIEHHAATIGLGIAVTRFGQQWFTDGAHPGGMLTNSEVELTPDTAQTAKQRFMASLRGTREPLVLGKGWQYQQIQIAPEESQFLETNKFTAAECARIFGPGVAEVLGYDTGGSMTYANVESRSTHLLVYSMNRWLNRAERVMTRMLPRGQYVKFNRDALLQSTTLTRFQAHEIALRNEWATINEIREVEDMPPVSWGDTPTGFSKPPTTSGGI